MCLVSLSKSLTPPCFFRANECAERIEDEKWSRGSSQEKYKRPKSAEQTGLTCLNCLNCKSDMSDTPTF